VAAVPFDSITLRKLIEDRLHGTQPSTDAGAALPAGFPPGSAADVRHFFPPFPIAAAVLIPIVDREEGLSVLLTQRSAQLKNHAGQISFPGGRIEANDVGPYDAALRETEEEIGLSRDYVTLAGYLAPQLIISGFWVTPAVGFVRPGFDLKLDPREVASTFEVPLAHILDAANHQSRERSIGTVRLQVYDIPFGTHNIWGATAGMLMALYRLLK
jgi:8-oxo-dGTP pyrophosphatase MutT (NUDIX family)